MTQEEQKCQKGWRGGEVHGVSVQVLRGLLGHDDKFEFVSEHAGNHRISCGCRQL